MNAVSLFDDSFKSILINSINTKYLSNYGYAKRYSYMEDNVLQILKKYKILDNDNVRIMKVYTIDKTNNIWFIGYKNYDIIQHQFHDDTIKLPPDKIYIGKSITPTPVGECGTTDYTNIIFNTAILSSLNKPNGSFYEIMNYWSDILKGYVEACGDEELYNKKYKNTFLFDKYIFDRMDYIFAASAYHFYTILHSKSVADTILPNIEYTFEKEQNSIYDMCGLDMNKFENFVDKVKYYLGKR